MDEQFPPAPQPPVPEIPQPTVIAPQIIQPAAAENAPVVADPAALQAVVEPTVLPLPVVAPTEAPAVVTPQVITPPVSVPATAAMMPVGVSESSMGPTDAKTHKSSWSKLVKPLIVVAVIVVLGITGFVVLYANAKLTPKTVTNDKYTYDFDFYKQSVSTKLPSAEAQKYMNKAIASADPVSEALITNCDVIGSKWTEAFSVHIYGASEPVCTASTSSEQIFVMNFPALNVHHLLVVTYLNDTQTSADYPTLKTIFSSIKVVQ
jgi:hypothetical protein